jgi:hypothetical protein
VFNMLTLRKVSNETTIETLHQRLNFLPVLQFFIDDSFIVVLNRDDHYSVEVCSTATMERIRSFHLISGQNDSRLIGYDYSNGILIVNCIDNADRDPKFK